MHVVHEVKRAAVGVHHADRALGDREDKRVHAHLALHRADDVQQRAELVAGALGVAEQVRVLQRDARLCGEQIHHIFIRGSKRAVFLVDSLQHTDDTTIGGLDGHAKDVDGTVTRSLVRTVNGGKHKL